MDDGFLALDKRVGRWYCPGGKKVYQETVEDEAVEEHLVQGMAKLQGEPRSGDLNPGVKLGFLIMIDFSKLGYCSCAYPADKMANLMP